MPFPPGFVWGAATSSYQIEGATSEGGRGPSIWDTFCARPGAIEDGSDGSVATDHYHRAPHDVALMKTLGLHAYRFSIAWPRMFPTGHESAPLEAGLEFYDRLVDTLLEAGITPWATLYHWDLPQGLEDAGGWPVRDTVGRYVHYADVMTRRLGDRVSHWITHNEPWVVSMLGYQQGRHAPGRTSWSDALAAAHHVLLSHGEAVPVIRANVSDAKVGITLNLCPAEPASPSATDAAAARSFDGHFNRWFLDPVFGRGYPADKLAEYTRLGHLGEPWDVVRDHDLHTIAAPLDFLGVNYYNRAVLRSDSVPEEHNHGRTVHVAPASEHTDMGWEVHAPSLEALLRRVHHDYRPKSIAITENGASYATGPDDSGRVRDVLRVRFFRDHLEACDRAIAAGVPLEAYFAWSLLDNFEWERGYAQRFGLFYVDYETQARLAKDSARWYARTIADNAVAPIDAADHDPALSVPASDQASRD